MAAAGPDGRARPQARQRILVARDGSDNAEQPQNEDQDDNSAKTDIHDIPPVFVLRLKRRARESRSTCCGGASMLLWYHFTLLQPAGFA
jgi:hypothetical protein